MLNRNKNIVNSNMHYFYDSIEFFLKTQKKLGIDEIALYACVPHIWIDHYRIDDANDICSLADAFEINIPVMIPKPYNYFITSTDKSLYEQSVKYYKNCVDYCQESGIDLIHIKCRFINDLDMKKQNEIYQQAVIEIGEYANSKSVILTHDMESLKSEGYLIINDYEELIGHDFSSGEKAIFLNEDDMTWDNPDEFDQKYIGLLKEEQ